jgi:DNA-binding NarL/FixJ family response regulator
MSAADGRPRPRVLLAEDNDAMRETLRELLEDEGVEVVGEAVDGVEAVALAQTVIPDVVLMDLRMPRLNGLEATQAIKQVCPEVRVLVLSAYADAGLSEDAAAAGADGYVVKGSPYEALLAKVLDASRLATGADPQPATEPG